ncbi:uncharacterized protein LOC131432068 [Malaya genurostris]|uniref:uncharacterized protein LOC131432068 n=1 Tax=Malaya genurostris TaxID=325434 RepID=UPI0026F3C552|nr:uncharacterized protein LOC131432068 [Malaya genurostris]
MSDGLHPHVPKAKRYTPAALTTVDSLPRNATETSGSKFVGIFTGLSVEVCDPEAIAQLSLGGCFGQGTMSRSFPASIRNREQAEVPLEMIRERQLIRREEWSRKYGLSTSKDKTKVYVMSEVIEKQIEQEVLPIREFKNNADTVYNSYPVQENLSLLFEEAMFLTDKVGCLEVFTLDGVQLPPERLLLKITECTNNFITSYVSYIYFKSKNWIIKSGLKFGGDFLLYQKGPQFFHASFIVLLLPFQNGQKLPGHHDFQCLNRIAETTAKELLLLEVHYPRGLFPTDYVECAKRLHEFKVSETFPKHHNYLAARDSHQQSTTN